MLVVRLSQFLSRELFRLRYTIWPVETSVYFEKSSTVRGVRAEIIKGLKNRLRIKESEDEECDVRMFFCPIVSRAGTDITAVLSRVRADKPAIVIVLQHTFDEQAVVPSCREYEREKLVLVTFLFSEDKGLLVCQKNTEGFLKATRFLNMWASERINKQEKGIFRRSILYMLTIARWASERINKQEKGLFRRRILYMLMAICFGWGLYNCIRYYWQWYWSVFEFGWYTLPEIDLEQHFQNYS